MHEYVEEFVKILDESDAEEAKKHKETVSLLTLSLLHPERTDNACQKGPCRLSKPKKRPIENLILKCKMFHFHTC